MDERENVMTALEICSSECSDDCPMKDREWKETGNAACRAFAEEDIVELPERLVRRTIALLKAQEARVMSLNELSVKTDVYFESLVYDTICPALSAGSYDDGTVGLMTLEDELFYMDEADYGVQWRCWTSRPTKEQREATPWILAV